MRYNERFKQECILLGKHIIKLREERNMTIKELSIKTGIRPQYLKKIEAGIAYRVSLAKHLLKIAKCIKITISELFRYK